jgi:hypothetical protein
VTHDGRGRRSLCGLENYHSNLVFIGQTIQPGQTIQSEYFKDKLQRSDSHDGVNGPLKSVTVIDFKNLRETLGYKV